MISGDVADQVRKEHQALEQIADQLRKAIERTTSTDSRSWLAHLRERLEHFRAHMHHRLALEESGGFLKEVTRVRPTLSREVDHCHNEHREILQLTDGLYQDLLAVRPEQGESLRDLCLRVRHLLSEVRHHEERESLLVLFAFNTDIGGHE